jgi:hypothetical protein
MLTGLWYPCRLLAEEVGCQKSAVSLGILLAMFLIVGSIGSSVTLFELTFFVISAPLAIKSVNDVNVNKTINLPPINVDKSATLLNKDIKCGDVDITVDVGVDGQATAQVSLGVAAQGTIVPPEITDFAITVGMNTDINETLDLNAGASVGQSSGLIYWILLKYPDS